MTIFRVAYMPEFSKELLALIRDWCTAEMFSEDSIQIQLEHIVETFRDQEIEIPSIDLKLWKKLAEEEINYIEIKNR